MSSSKPSKHKPDPVDTNVDTAGASSSASSSSSSRFDAVTKTIFAPFQHRKTDSNKIFAELAPAIMTPRMMSHAATVTSRSRGAVGAAQQHMDFATLGRAPMRIALGSRRLTSRELQIVEDTDDLLRAPIPDAPELQVGAPSLLRGFQATIPSADKGRSRRRQTRNIETPRLGLKKLAASARGMIGEGAEEEEEDGVLVGGAGPDRERGRKGRRKRGRESLAANKVFGRDELERQTDEIRRDKENLHVRRSLINSEIDEVSRKIAALDAIRQRLEEDLLKLQEDELELDDELEMVKEQLNVEESRTRKGKSTSAPHMQSSRRRKGPAFLPSEHDDLPPGVAFMSLEVGNTPVTALDFSEPYGTLVTATADEPQPRVWDLLTGTEIGRLRGHTGTVKSMQVEDHVCLTGAEDGSVRLWDLRRVEEDEWEGGMVHLEDVAEEDEHGEGVVVDKPNGIRNGTVGAHEDEEREEPTGPCVRVLGGHSKAVTALYFDDDTLVTGASDKTLRQWDLNTGQCVLTMDLLWALSHSAVAAPGGAGSLFSGATAAAGTFAVPTPPYADGTWDLYQDFIGSVQFWGYALVSGSGDGAVRMWDMRTGQAHRTLLGHTGPVTALQFDEIHIASGSLDKSVRIWDLRSGGIFETIKYDHGVTALQFDSRKVVSAAGENGVKIYNRTSMQHSTLSTNGHVRPVERLRYMDRYLVSGGRDAMVKIWAL